MKTSKNGIKFLVREEGSRLKAYQDSRGIWTIGVGHTSAAGPPKVTPSLKITKEEEETILLRDLKEAEEGILKLLKVSVNQNEFDALVSLVHNIGIPQFTGSSVLRLLNKNDRTGAANAFLLWKKAGKDLNILLARRKRERELFLTPHTAKPSAVPKPPPVRKDGPQKPVEAPPVPSKLPPYQEPRKNLLVRLLEALKALLKR